MMPDGDGGPDGGGGDGGGNLVVGRNRREAASAAGRGCGDGRGRHRGRDHEDGFESRGVSGLGGTRALPARSVVNKIGKDVWNRFSL